MQSSSNSSSVEPDQSSVGAISDPSKGCAPDVAPNATDVALLRINVSRIDRPTDFVDVVAGDRLTLAARVNLLTRTDGRDGDRLSQCLAPDYAMLVAPGRHGRIPAHAAQAVLIITFDADVWNDVPVGAKRNAEQLSGQLLCDRMAVAMIERIALSVDETPLLADILARSLLAHFGDLAQARGAVRRPGGLTARQLTALREAVEDALGHDWTVAALAQIAGLSPFHFARAFKISMGTAPLTWIRLRRVTVAQKLLLETRQPITAIAAAMGYDSPSRFASLFRKVVGQSPSRFRTA